MPFINIRKILPLQSNNTLLYTYVNTSFGLLKSTIICNTLDIPSKVWFQVKGSSEPINSGSLLYGITLDPNETFELPERMVLNGDSIIGWSDNANAVSFSAHIQIL